MNSETSITDDAFWQVPGTAYEITYPLSLFHDIDFGVNEAFRQIPHGGLEIGGVLYGAAEGNRLSIRAFRPIECAHASGPSFNLSEAEVSKLARQASEPAQDPDLAGLTVLGWFISHTRGPLTINAKEVAIFDQIFPGPGKITMLVKPERFQPTRFGFLVRNVDGTMPTDASATAIILPLPGRSEAAANGPIPSLSAPEAPALPASAPETPDAAQAEPSQADAREKTRERKTTVLRSESIKQDEAPSPPAVPSPLPSRPARQQWREPERTRELPLRRQPLVREEGARRATPVEPARSALPKAGSGVQFAVVLLIAALLGCCVGYWAYLQLPSPVIPLSVRAQPSGLVVTWPADQTRGISYAAIRINDGDPVMLSPSERAVGQATLSVNGDEIKIELIAQHWLRDSRGIVRYIKGRAGP